MGRYEDLLAQAKEGDESAFEALETEFGGSTLREKAERTDSLEKQLDQAMPFLRKARLDELVGKLSDDLREAGLEVDDLGDFDPESLSLEDVQDKAQAKLERKQASRLAHAQEAGFESVEEYEQALEAAKQQKQARKEGMEDVAGGAASGGGAPPGTDEPTLHETGQSAFKDAKGEGRSDDIALARGIEAILDSQLAGAEE